MVPDSALQTATAIAREAGAVLMRHFGRELAIEHKGAIDLVTQADRASEALIVERLAAAFPDHAILAEEGGGTARAGRPRWLVDPLDGTTNFAHGYPLFGVSIALEVEGQIELGVVYEPARDELFAARRGCGATLGGAALRVSPIGELSRALLVTGFPYSIRERPEPTVGLLRAFLAAGQGLRRDGSAALDLCFVAAGRLDGFWELDLKPWDVAAGSLVVSEAGGRVTNLDGSAFDVGGGAILATNGHLHDAMLEIARPLL